MAFDVSAASFFDALFLYLRGGDGLLGDASECTWQNFRSTLFREFKAFFWNVTLRLYVCSVRTDLNESMLESLYAFKCFSVRLRGCMQS